MDAPPAEAPFVVEVCGAAEPEPIVVAPTDVDLGDLATWLSPAPRSCRGRAPSVTFPLCPSAAPTAARGPGLAELARLVAADDGGSGGGDGGGSGPGAPEVVVFRVQFTADEAAPQPGCHSAVVLIYALRGGEERPVASGRAPPARPAARVPAAALRALLAEGWGLRATVCVADLDAPIPAGLQLPVPPAGHGAFQYAPLLDGPFADATVVAGGREWRVHRAVLAALSPAFHAALGGGMVEAATAQIAIGNADPAVVELLIKHIYAHAGSVSLAEAPELQALAARYLLRSSLARHLLALLAAPRFAPEALAPLLPLAARWCGEACELSLFDQAAAALGKLRAAPEFAAWPIECVERVLRRVPAAAALEAAAQWVAARGEGPAGSGEFEAPAEATSEGEAEAEAATGGAPGAPAPSGQAGSFPGAGLPRAAARDWLRLVDAIDWQSASLLELRAAESASERLLGPEAARAPPLRDRLLAGYRALAGRQAEELLRRAEALEAAEQDREELQERVALLESRVEQWQAAAGAPVGYAEPPALARLRNRVL
ncbi:hypothetical protein Rsub_09255 [Raphidocelis subcapitata]|uniref:BTB domain-containing protein n=1 Tax=Raphidocelis subcapitata TaxID=307507 RepID=A0A2V0P9D7_9CHLO|nr:hypothetical protein Rsub_09255 [Raphidocelis subcapitata]|eukprot:GBF96456.1 hypothetical protein Rsub_09255 [Raphidocelis subcapitata]